MIQRKCFCLSLPPKVYDIINEQKKDVPRSRFILRLIEKGLGLNNTLVTMNNEVKSKKGTEASSFQHQNSFVNKQNDIQQT